MKTLTDEEITALILEPKTVPNNWFSRLEAKDKVHFQHKEKEVDIEGGNGSLFSPAFHIHKATQRYQENGYRIDGYAEVTSRYSDFHTALEQFLIECNIRREDDGAQTSLFEGGGF